MCGCVHVFVFCFEACNVFRKVYECICCTCFSFMLNQFDCHLTLTLVITKCLIFYFSLKIDLLIGAYSVCSCYIFVALVLFFYYRTIFFFYSPYSVFIILSFSWDIHDRFALQFLDSWPSQKSLLYLKDFCIVTE